jgi:hypothetical protein
MTWDSSLPILVRNAIGDFAAPPKYSDDQLGPLILTASQSVLFNVTPVQPYVIDIENLTLVPDPTDAIINDTSFIYLVTLKSSSMLLYAEVRAYGQQAIAIRDGTSAIDLKRDLKALMELANTYEKELNKAIAYYFRNAGIIQYKAIVSPYKTLLSSIDQYFYRGSTLWPTYFN